MKAHESYDRRQWGERIREMLLKGYIQLYKAGQPESRWDYVQATGLAAWCQSLVEPPESEWSLCVAEWLQSEQVHKNKEDAGSWETEINETALCIIALRELLCHVGARKQSAIEEAIRAGKDWLWTKQLNPHGNWNDEPWETSWALIALFDEETEIPPKDAATLCRALTWLLSLEFPAMSGRIVTPHYTAYLLLIRKALARWLHGPGVAPELSTSLDQVKTRAVDYLIRGLADSSTKELWTNEAWSNGQILYALIYAEPKFVDLHPGLVAKAIDWFMDARDKKKGNWSDIEDTCWALMALAHLLRAIQPESQPTDIGDLLDFVKKKTIDIKPERRWLAFTEKELVVRIVGVRYSHPLNVVSKVGGAVLALLIPLVAALLARLVG